MQAAADRLSRHRAVRHRYDNVAVDTATANGIVVTRVPDYRLDEVRPRAGAVAQRGARDPRATDRRDGGWAVPRAVNRLVRRLALVGVGQIGLACRAGRGDLGSWGMTPRAGLAAGIRTRRDTQDALSEADIVSPRTAHGGERNLIGTTINLMRRSPIIVNTARGGLVDLDAAVLALDDGRLSAVALDVVDPEPLPQDHPLRTHPRAIITPHMAFYSVEAEQELQRRAAEEVARALRGEPADVPVNADALAARG